MCLELKYRKSSTDKISLSMSRLFHPSLLKLFNFNPYSMCDYENLQPIRNVIIVFS